MNGIDVCHYQGNIDWKKVKRSGITFAMLKASQGSKLSDPESPPFEDENFGKYVKGAAENGIFCGAYHFLTGVTPQRAEKEADFFIKTLEKYRNRITFPCACDLEGRRYENLSKGENAALVKVFTEKVGKAGYVPMLYTNMDYYKNRLDMNALKGIDIWFARYYAARSPLPKPDIPGMTMFQWNDAGVVDGVSGRVDLDVCYFDYRRDFSKTENPVSPPRGGPGTVQAGDTGTFQTGDTVAFLESAAAYWPAGPKIPAFVKERTHTIMQTKSQNQKVMKGGSVCVLLGEILTWTAVENLKKA